MTANSITYGSKLSGDEQAMAVVFAHDIKQNAAHGFIQTEDFQVITRYGQHLVQKSLAPIELQVKLIKSLRRVARSDFRAYVRNQFGTDQNKLQAFEDLIAFFVVYPSK